MIGKVRCKVRNQCYPLKSHDKDAVIECTRAHCEIEQNQDWRKALGLAISKSHCVTCTSIEIYFIKPVAKKKDK